MHTGLHIFVLMLTMHGTVIFTKWGSFWKWYPACGLYITLMSLRNVRAAHSWFLKSWIWKSTWRYGILKLHVLIMQPSMLHNIRNISDEKRDVRNMKQTKILFHVTPTGRGCNEYIEKRGWKNFWRKQHYWLMRDVCILKYTLKHFCNDVIAIRQEQKSNSVGFWQESAHNLLLTYSGPKQMKQAIQHNLPSSFHGMDTHIKKSNNGFLNFRRPRPPPRP